MLICVVIGSRADEGFLIWPRKLLREQPWAQVWDLDLRREPPIVSLDEAFRTASEHWTRSRPEWILLVGDRWEVLGCALAAHLDRIPLVHLCGGDRTEGSYDDAMRDCISRLATMHFVTSEAARDRLLALSYSQVHLVGNPGVDYILYGTWKRERPHPRPYVVVSYQAETIDDTVDLAAVHEAVAGRYAVWVRPNADRGNERIYNRAVMTEWPHDEFLNLLAHCEEFIGNSSAIFYEAPVLGVKTTLIGKRQRGRVVPWGDGHASERIVQILKEVACPASS